MSVSACHECDGVAFHLSSLLPPSTSLSSSTPLPSMTAHPHHALRPGRGHFRPILPVSSTTTSMQAATLARTYPTRRMRMEMAAAAMSSVPSRLRRPRAPHRRYPARASTSWASPWAPTILLPSYTSEFRFPVRCPPSQVPQDDQRPQVSALYLMDGTWRLFRRLQRRRV